MASTINIKLIIIQDTAFFWWKHSSFSTSTQPDLNRATTNPMLASWQNHNPVTLLWRKISRVWILLLSNLHPQLSFSMHRHPVINYFVRHGLTTKKNLLAVNCIKSGWGWGCGLTSETFNCWWTTTWKEDFLLSHINSIPQGQNADFCQQKHFLPSKQVMHSKTVFTPNARLQISIRTWKSELKSHNRSYLLELPTLGAHKSQGVVLVDVGNHWCHSVSILSENREPSHHGWHSQGGIHIQATEIVINC